MNKNMNRDPNKKPLPPKSGAVKPTPVKKKPKAVTQAPKVVPPNQPQSARPVKQSQDKKPKTLQKKPARVYMHDQFFPKLPMASRMNAKKSLGLDIDPDKIRWVLIKRYKNDLQVLKWGIQKFPTEEKDRRRALQIALENIKAKIYKSGMKVNVSIFSPEISTREVIFPEMKKEADLKQAIFLKNETDIQNFDNKAIWSYDILNRFESDGLTKLRISVVVAPYTIVNEYLQIFEASGIEIKHLMPRRLAIQSAYRKMLFRPDRDLLIDIGYDLTQMCFIKNGRIEVVRNVSIGSRNLEVTIHAQADQDTPAEDKDEKPAESKTEQAHGLRSRLISRIQDLKNKQNPVLHTFFSEILRSLSFFQGKDVNQYIERIFVTGYGVRKESLMPYLKSRLGIPLFILAPQFVDRTTRTTEFGGFFSTLGTASQDDTAVNILPEDYKTRFVIKKLNTLLGFLLVITIAGLSYISFKQAVIIDQKEKLVVQNQKEYDLLNPIEGKYKEVLNLISEVNNKNEELRSYIKGKPPVIEILRLLSNELPNTIRLEKLEFVKINVDSKGNPTDSKFKNDYLYKIDITGIITSDPLVADVTLINFVNHMNELDYFKHLELLNKQKDNELKITRFGLRLFK